MEKINYNKTTKLALYYKSLDWSVFPVRVWWNSEKEKWEKTPLVETWKPYQSDYATDDQVTKWFDEEFLDAYIGVATGKLSQIIVLDLDSYKKEFETFKLPETVMSKTISGGQHAYFNWPGFEVRNTSEEAGKCLKADGGFVVLPSGKNDYSWIKGPAEIEIADFPKELLEIAKRRKKDWREISKGVPDGKRNMTAAQYTGKLLHDLSPELWETVAWNELKRWNQKNKPPTDESELRTVFESITGRESKRREDKQEPEVLAIMEEPEPVIDPSGFHSISLLEVKAVLDLTIKRDNHNKIITFLGLLSAFTDSSQFNLLFNSLSSTGKSYIPLQVASLFPKNSLLKLAYCSPTAFFHEVEQYQKEDDKGVYTDLSRKILIFIDSPHFQLLERLRPMLSHDEKIIYYKITDRAKSSRLRTKNIRLKGYPAVVFCTAKLMFDEQESTRFLLLSPDTEQEKLEEAIELKIDALGNEPLFKSELDDHSERIKLKDRILAIKQAEIDHVKISDTELLKAEFKKRYPSHKKKPRHMRDVGYVIFLIKSIALLNLWFRELDQASKTITANREDILEGFKLWDQIYRCQDLNLSPFVYKVFEEVIKQLWNEPGSKMSGIYRKDILKKYSNTYGRPLNDATLRQQILPMLTNAGLIYEETAEDKRSKLVFLVEEDPKTDTASEGVDTNIERIF